MTESQSNDQATSDAKRYIDAILEINRKYGFTVDLSPQDYDQAVHEAAEPSRRLAAERREAPGASG